MFLYENQYICCAKIKLLGNSKHIFEVQYTMFS